MKRVVRRPAPKTLTLPTAGLVSAEDVVFGEPSETLRQRVQFPMATDKQIVKFDGGFFDGPQRRSPAIGIDSSVAGFAFAVFCPEDGTYYAWRLKSPKAASGEGVWRLLQIRDFFGRTLHGVILRSPQVLHICMEGYGFASQRGHSLGEVGGMVKLVLTDRIGWDRLAAYPTLVAPSALQKYVTGKGNSPKQEMMMILLKKYGWEINDDNACDALALARLAAAVNDPSLATLKYEQEVVSKLRLDGVHSEWPSDQPMTLNRVKPPSTSKGSFRRTPPSPPAPTAPTPSSSPAARTSRVLRRRSPTPSTTGSQ